MLRTFFLPILALMLMANVATANEFGDISVADLHTAIHDKAVTIIDVNGTDSFTQAHVPTAIDYAVVQEQLADHLPADKASLIVAYCSGPRCGAYKRAATEAAELGYTNVKHMSAGISGWLAADVHHHHHGESGESGDVAAAKAMADCSDCSGCSAEKAAITGKTTCCGGCGGAEKIAATVEEGAVTTAAKACCGCSADMSAKTVSAEKVSCSEGHVVTHAAIAKLLRLPTSQS